MKFRSRLSRRWIGGIALAGAIGLLVAGETFLSGRLGAVGFIVLWTLCFLLTIAAVVIALADVRATAARTAREQRDLFDSTLQKIQEEASEKRRHDRNKSNGG